MENPKDLLYKQMKAEPGDKLVKKVVIPVSLISVMFVPDTEQELITAKTHMVCI